MKAVAAHSRLAPRLSICIATLNRERFIAQTLDSIVEQLDARVELIVVDGASSDGTASVVGRYVAPGRSLRYFRENVNSGIDGDYDKAIGYARGDYCWLMTDDDLLGPHAIERVLAELASVPLDLLIVNAEIRNADLRTVLHPRFLRFEADRIYSADEREDFFAEVADYLSFIGGVVIRRARWLERDRRSYFGTLFVHVGVIFQLPALARVKVLAEPLVIIRYGNAMWSARGFEVWTFKWPALIWSFDHITDPAKRRVVARRPWSRLRRLIFYRAIGAYSFNEYRRLVAGHGASAAPGLCAALLPARFANALSAVYWFVFNRESRGGIYDLARSRHSTAVTRAVARALGIPNS